MSILCQALGSILDTHYFIYSSYNPVEGDTVIPIFQVQRGKGTWPVPQLVCDGPRMLTVFYELQNKYLHSFL